MSLQWLTRIGCWIATLCLLFSVNAFATCKVTSPVTTDIGQPIPLERGFMVITMDCKLTSQHVLNFPLDVVNHPHASAPFGDIPVLASARQAFLLPAGEYPLKLTLGAQRSRFLTPQLDDVATFNHTHTLHLITMSAFVGFCLALIVYVGVLGRGIRESGFYSYSAYIACAGMFFCLQEGLPNALFPGNIVTNDIGVKMIFAGLTVYTAQRFISRLLDFRALLVGWEYRLLQRLALSVLAISVAQLVLPYSLTVWLSQLMGWLTLAVIVGVIAATGYAVLRKVTCARLVLLSLVIMLAAMVFRVALQDVSPFLHRYSLIFAVTIEALLLAVAASEKVKRLEQEKIHAFKHAAKDALCPVLNRRGWEDAARRMLKKHQQQGGFLALLFVDLDRFKAINDQHGHALGDKALIIVAKILNSHCRASDLVGRLGGDEFVVLSHCFNRNQANRLIARIRARFDDLVLSIDGQQVSLSASVGGQVVDIPHTDLNMLLHETDMLMYGIKADRVAKRQAPANQLS